MKKQGNMTPPKAHNSLTAAPKDIEVDEISGKEFKRINIKMMNEFQENTENNWVKEVSTGYE